jgi:two-component system cell cycle response regulator
MTALSARQVIIRISIIIAVSELVIMYTIGKFFPELDHVRQTLLDTVILVILDAPAIYFWVIKPFIEARDETLAQVSHLALTDSLTQISNRRQIMQLLQMTIANCKRHKYYGALLLIDLNDFKPINDNYGHDAGDAVLVEVANRLKSLVREVDAVGRLGGDEFIIILPRLGDDEATAINELGHITERVVTSLRWPILFDEHKLQITASIGICILDANTNDDETVIKHADEAMYTAKRNKKDFSVNIFRLDAQ